MRFRAILLASFVAALAAGCVGYRVGPTNGAIAGDKSIQVHFFRNLTREPRLTEAVTISLRRQLQQDGTYQLATDGTADIVVTGSISKYERSGLSFQPGDIQTVRDFTISIIARVSATERGTGKKILSDHEVEGRTTVRAGTDLASAERQAVPLMAEDLARRVTALLVDGDW